MKKRWIAALLFSLFMVLPAAQAQNNASTNAAPVSDNPSAGLNLNDPDQPAPLTGLAAKFGHNLVALQDGDVKKFDSASLQGVKYWAFYYSASWCHPCRLFTPKLVEFYKDFKTTHPNFELVFVNHDQNENDMVDYMKADGMPWPAVRFDDIEKTGLNKYCGPGIPDLVLVDDTGKVLSDSFINQDYRGPYEVVEDIKKMVPSP